MKKGRHLFGKIQNGPSEQELAHVFCMGKSTLVRTGFIQRDGYVDCGCFLEICAMKKKITKKNFRRLLLRAVLEYDINRPGGDASAEFVPANVIIEYDSINRAGNVYYVS